MPFLLTVRFRGTRVRTMGKTGRRSGIIIFISQIFDSGTGHWKVPRSVFEGARTLPGTDYRVPGASWKPCGNFRYRFPSKVMRGGAVGASVGLWERLFRGGEGVVGCSAVLSCMWSRDSVGPGWVFARMPRYGYAIAGMGRRMCGVGALLPGARMPRCSYAIAGTGRRICGVGGVRKAFRCGPVASAECLKEGFSGRKDEESVCGREENWQEAGPSGD